MTTIVTPHAYCAAIIECKILNTVPQGYLSDCRLRHFKPAQLYSVTIDPTLKPKIRFCNQLYLFDLDNSFINVNFIFRKLLINY